MKKLSEEIEKAMQWIFIEARVMERQLANQNGYVNDKQDEIFDLMKKNAAQKRYIEELEEKLGQKLNDE